MSEMCGWVDPDQVRGECGQTFLSPLVGTYRNVTQQRVRQETPIFASVYDDLARRTGSTEDPSTSTNAGDDNHA